jgi:hypothetical protein
MGFDTAKTTKYINQFFWFMLENYIISHKELLPYKLSCTEK